MISFLIRNGETNGRWWGSKNKRPVLCLHGWQDNANSFKTLIPLLSSELSYLTIDFPGHGFSSYIPKGVFYKAYGELDVIRRIQHYFEWEKVSLMGHSFGAACSYLFAASFPNTVDFFVAIDLIKPESEDFPKNAAKNIENMLVQESLNPTNARSYDKNELLQRWIKATDNSLTEKSCEILMERGTKVNEGAFRLTRDVRLKFSFSNSFSQKEQLKMAESIICNVLYIKAKSSSYYEKKEDVLEVLSVIEKSARYFQKHELPGTHHIHLNNPEVVAPVINSFFKTIANQQ